MSRKKATQASESELELIDAPLQSREEQPKTVVHPNKFYGEPGEDIEKWLRSFDRVAKANNWSQKRQCDILPAFLRDRAAEFYDEIADSEKLDLSSLKIVLLEHFMPKEARRFYYADLYARKQGISEPDDDFGRSIQQLVRRAYAEMPVEHQDTLMREHFVNWLRPDLKRIVLISDPKSFTQALELAKWEEINNQIANGSAPWVKPSTQRNPAPIAAMSTDHAPSDRLDHLEGVVEKLALSLAEANMKQVHRRYRYDRKVNRNERNLRCSDGRPICNFCKKVGHVENRCNEKKKLTDQSKN